MSKPEPRDLSFLGVYEEEKAILRLCLPSGNTRRVALSDDELLRLIDEATEIFARRYRRQREAELPKVTA